MTTKTLSVACDQCAAIAINGVACHETGCSGHFTYKHRGRSYAKFQVYGLDVWGSPKEGYEVNDRSKMGTIMVPIDMNDRDILKALKHHDYLNRRCHYRSFTLDGDDSFLSVDYGPTRVPLFQLERT